ncbi:MAG: phosphate acyltransferase PlsX [Pseudomonadota bacterium]
MTTNQANSVTISIDAMGGDEGPEALIPGLAISRQRNPDLSFVLVGDEEKIHPVLQRHEAIKACSRIVHTDVAVPMDAKPSQALRSGRRISSMWKAVEEVKTGGADICVSAGNTGALMAMSKFCLKMQPGIGRPGIAAIWPTTRGESIVLDVGATVGADADMLVEFALLGSAMARAVFSLDRPTVGLLNVGVEEVKGLEPIREAGQRLKEAQYAFLDYVGFVEGTDIGQGSVDVIVTEGFSGNIALKTAEGTAKQIGGYLRDAMTVSMRTKLGALLAKPGFNALRRKLDPRRVNGGVFLGLNGTVIKSHGSADALGFAAAVDLARNMVINGLSEKIAAQLAEAEAIQGARASGVADQQHAGDAATRPGAGDQSDVETSSSLAKRGGSLETA